MPGWRRLTLSDHGRALACDVALVGVPVALVLLGATTNFDLPRPGIATTAFGVAGCLILLFRRRQPVAVLAAEVVFSLIPTLGLGAAPDLYASFVPSMIAICAVAAYRPARYLWLVPSFAVVVCGGFMIRSADFRTAGQVVFNGLAIVLAVIIGAALRHVRGRATSESARASLLEREQDLQAREAVVAERERIARELHDVIAHDISLMVIQAGAAQRVMTSPLAEVAEALRLIQDCGLRAVDELHLLLGMLRDDGQSLAPQRRLAAVDELIGEVRRAGVPVELRITRDRRDLGSALEVSAYRVVQEALTNVLKHACGAAAVVELRYAPAALTVCVADDGAGAAAIAARGGHGLLGMRERTRMFGCSFEAGRRADGGWSITAVMPVPADNR